jgi:Protein of unknown function (DUF4231)
MPLNLNVVKHMEQNTAIGLTPEQYINERVKQYQAWYDRKSVATKARFLRMRAFTVIGGGLVPVLINIDKDLSIKGYSVVKIIVTLVSLLVVIFVSLESVYHYREQWKNYRSTEQLLGHELFLFQAKVGPYKGLDAREAFLQFVERVEDVIAAENAATLNVMTLASEAADDGRKKRGDGA